MYVACCIAYSDVYYICFIGVILIQCFKQCFHVVVLLVIYMLAVVDQLPRLGKRELICLLPFTCNYVVSVRRGFFFLLVLRMGYVILLWHSLSLPYNYFYKVDYLRINAGSFR